jgi:ribosome biogenesis GTPase / thiamine phosphate phosphatase
MQGRATPPARMENPVDSNASFERYGWTRSLETTFRPYRDAGLQPGRVTVVNRGSWAVRLTGTDPVGGGPDAAHPVAGGLAVNDPDTTGRDAADLDASVSGRFRHDASALDAFPAVGDWVAVEVRPDGATIQAVLPRTSRFARKAPGKVPGDQVVAANVDTVFLVNGLDRDFSPRRLERYLALARASGADPVIILTKADLCDDVPGRRATAGALDPGVAVHAVSALARTGLEALERYLPPGRTVALLGSSGVGKSTLINALLGYERQTVREVRSGDGRGRHTTMRRELVELPGGALVIDTPGLREVGLWEAEGGLDDVFAEVAELGRTCRFGDCRHEGEPGCAVAVALRDGTLTSARLGSYRKLQRELAALEERRSPGSRAEERRRGRFYKRHTKEIQAAGKGNVGAPPPRRHVHSVDHEED